MTESVITLNTNGGSTGWDQMNLGYDTTSPISYGSSETSALDWVFSLQDAAVAGVISKISIGYRIKAASYPYGGMYFKGITRINGTKYYTAAVNRNNSSAPEWYYFDIATNPATSSAWLWPEIDALNAGIQMDGGYGDWAYMYQYVVLVYYEPEVYVPPTLTKGSVGIGAGSMMF